MLNVPRHFILEFSGDEGASLLNEWRWLIGNDKQPLMFTTSGDAFLAAADGSVFWLETGSGQLTEIAHSVAAFEAALEEESNQREWLLTPVIENLRASGKVLQPGECYGFQMPAVLGGAYDGDNRIVIRAEEHFGFTGHLHNQIRQLPDGAKVKLKWTD